MSKEARRVASVLGALLAVGSTALAERTAFPVKVSENKRYFVDQNGKPVFWLGTTQWQLFREYTLEDARTILEKSAANGFVFVAGHAHGRRRRHRSRTSTAQKPWINDDPLTPNEAYFKNVDAVRPDRPREQPRHLDDALPPALPQVHHAGEGPRLGEVAGAAVQGRAQHRLVDDAGGQARSSSRSCASWRPACARATAAAT